MGSRNISRIRYGCIAKGESMFSTEASNGVGRMTEDKPPTVVIRRLLARGEGDINMMSVSGLVSRSGLSNRRELTTYEDYSGPFDLSRVACALIRRGDRE